jgi:hypothetical protein
LVVDGECELQDLPGQRESRGGALWLVSGRVEEEGGECKESDACSQSGGGGELGNLKILNIWLHYFLSK